VRVKSPLDRASPRPIIYLHGMGELERYEGAATIEKVAALCRRRGFVYPSSDIYGGLGSSYDYGHYGVLLKQHVKAAWQRALVQERDDIVLLDSAIILNPEVWVASGHVGGFSDPLVDCRTCKLRYRADHIAESACGRRPSKHPGETPDCDLTEARAFNLMFETSIGPVRDEGSLAYLRPETAQGIFVNFKNVTSSLRVKPPFGIAQIGKSFRNEITPGNFLFRMREFEQMEMEFFVPPEESERWYRYWIAERQGWYLELGLRESHLRVRAHDADELSHYSSGTSDLEYLFPIGWSELEGIANRGDFDLSAHAASSGTKLEWIGHEERYVPHVIEPAAGADRATLAFLVDAYDEEEIGGEQRTVLRLHPRLAPVKVAVLPLVGKDEGLVGKARPLYEELRRSMTAEYDDSASIGKRYRRQDEIGTPWALTIDQQTLVDGTITIRDRDTLAQERIPIEAASDLLQARLGQPWRPR
jgi:glycyl-tRNA synthetase